MKVRARAGIRLNLPFGIFKGAATVVFYSSQEQYDGLAGAFLLVKQLLTQIGGSAQELADRLFIERA